MNAQKTMDEIDVFLSKSLLKKSKITKAQIVDLIETKWAEADEEEVQNLRCIHLRAPHDRRIRRVKRLCQRPALDR